MIDEAGSLRLFVQEMSREDRQTVTPMRR